MPEGLGASTGTSGLAAAKGEASRTPEKPSSLAGQQGLGAPGAPKSSQHILYLVASHCPRVHTYRVNMTAHFGHRG